MIARGIMISLYKDKETQLTDVGLRNARLNFRRREEDHIMENILYNELLMRGYDVDVGVVKASIVPWYDDHGILYIGIEQFLLDENGIGS